MTRQDIVEWLRRERVETGSLICLGCGHEHACSTKGCAVLRAAADLIERQHESMVNMVRALVRQQKTIERLNTEIVAIRYGMLSGKADQAAWEQMREIGGDTV